MTSIWHYEVSVSYTHLVFIGSLLTETIGLLVPVVLSLFAVSPFFTYVIVIVIYHYILLTPVL